MARGAISKEKITKIILETFAGSFLYDKEIRIPINEDGELIQIKVTLTAAKTNVESGDDIKIPGLNNENNAINFDTQNVSKEKIEVTEEEKQNVATLLKNLGL